MQKTIRELIEELQTFENQDLVVMVSNDEQIFTPVQMVGQIFDDNGKAYCGLMIQE